MQKKSFTEKDKITNEGRKNISLFYQKKYCIANKMMLRIENL